MAKKRTYSLKLIKADYTYSIEQIVDLFDVDIATVRHWIRDGLKRIPETRPYLVHSSDLRSFLDKKQKARKHSCGEQEVFCCRCQAARTPKMGTAKAKVIPNGSVLLQAICSVCNGKINKSIKRQSWSGSHPMAIFLCDA